MTNQYFVATGVPASASHGSSAVIRAPFNAIQSAFDKLPTISGKGNTPIMVNSAGTELDNADTPSKRSSFIASLGITATIAELNYTDGATSNIQSQIDTLASLVGAGGLTPTDNGVVVGNGSSFVVKVGASARAFLGLAIGSNVQAYSSILNATTASFTTTLNSKLSGIESGADVTDSANVAASGAAMNSQNLSGLTNTSTARANLGVAIGTNVQAYSSELAVLAGNVTYSGTENFGIGDGALVSNTTGQSNFASGLNALNANTEGSWNVAVGQYSLSGNTTGSNNFGGGYGALGNNTEGYDNTASGASSLSANSLGIRNTAHGRAALQGASGASSYNTAVGYLSAANVSVVNEGVYLGSRISAQEGSANEIVIGDSAAGGGSNSVTIGNPSIGKTVLRGNVIVDGISPLSGGGAGVTISNNSSPGTTPNNTISLTSSDASFGNTTLNLITEGTPIASVSLTSPDLTFAIKINGTTYYIPMKATND